jgi:hypothetical protein
MPSIATVTVFSFMTPMPTDVPQAIRSSGRSVMSWVILLLTLLTRSGLAEARGSQLSLPRVPVPLKIDNQLIAKMQERLLEGVRCQIPA